MRRIRPQDRKRDQEPTRCTCEGGKDRAAEHAKPGKKTAEHGDVFRHTGACIHDELSRTTMPAPKRLTVFRFRL